MDLRAIRDHLCLARAALGPEHALSARLNTVERNLTPGDPLWRDDAVSTERDLLEISAELEHLPRVMSLHAASGGEENTDRAQAEVPPGVNEAIKQIADAIELL